jgi:hypothetical protein
MGKHRTVSPDFVSRQEASTRLMLSLRQVDRLMSRGTLPRTKVSANRTGILRIAFDGYLASLNLSAMQKPPFESASQMEATSAQNLHGYSACGYVSYRFETADDCREFALMADRIGLRGSISRNEPPGHVILKWHRDLGFEVGYLESILTRWSFPFVRKTEDWDCRDRVATVPASQIQKA